MHEAETLLRKTVAADPKSSDAFLQLGILSSKRGEYTDAIQSFARAIEANPQQGEAHYRLGVVYDRIGKSEQAKQQFALHDAIEKTQAEATEQERLRVKQFLIVLKSDPTTPGKS